MLMSLFRECEEGNKNEKIITERTFYLKVSFDISCHEGITSTATDFSSTLSQVQSLNALRGASLNITLREINIQDNNFG